MNLLTHLQTYLPIVGFFGILSGIGALVMGGIDWLVNDDSDLFWGGLAVLTVSVLLLCIVQKI